MSDELRQLNEACARAMGWREEGDGWWYPTDKEHPRFRRAPSFGADFVSLLEDEIERRDRSRDYVAALIHVLGVYGDREWYDWDREWGHAVWDVIRAMPEQRARAFLEAIK